VTPQILILRPQPGADRTAERARKLKLEPLVAPLFTIVPLTWDAPDPGRYRAVLLTSANAARHGGSQLNRFRHLPCYAVGEATAAAARAAGFADVRTGCGDGSYLVRRMAEEGVSNALHLRGRDHAPLAGLAITIEGRNVYAAEAEAELAPATVEAVRGGAIPLIHSARAGAAFSRLADAAGLERGRIMLAAISEAAAAAAGSGWKARYGAPAPTDDALLELAAKLCKDSPFGATETGG
jgi:uroporphyrinogen-III synthase